jgi:hypothetical protein
LLLIDVNNIQVVSCFGLDSYCYNIPNTLILSDGNILIKNVKGCCYVVDGINYKILLKIEDFFGELFILKNDIIVVKNKI